MSKLKLKYANKSVIENLQYQQGAMMLANDSQQIYFDLSINGIPQRRKFSGLIYLDLQSDRLDIQSPSDSLYFVIATCKFYYYYADQWKTLTSSAIIHTTMIQMQSMTECDTQKLYLDQSSNSLYYGINISGSVLWINLSAYDKISDYIGGVNIRMFDGEDYLNVISTQDGNANVNIGNIDGELKLYGTAIKYNGNNLNSASGLVQLNAQGKIPTNLLYAAEEVVYNDSYFATKQFSVYGLTNNQKTFTFEQLGIQQATIIQLLDDQDLIRDDVIPVYWTSTGVTIQLSPIAELITEQTGNFKIKYLVAQQYNVNQTSNTATIATKTFDPYGLTNNLKSFSFIQLGLSSNTMVQLLDDQGLIRDDVIPVYWTSTGLQINFAPIAQLLTQSGHMWQLKYMVAGSARVNNITVSSSVVQVQFNPYGLTNNLKTFTYTELNLTKRTIVQLIDNENLVRDDVVPVYWTDSGLTINLQPVASYLTQNMIWKIAYIAPGGSVNSQVFATKAYVDSKIQEVLSQIS